MFKSMIIAAGLALAVSMPAYADKNEKKAEPETKQICVDVQGKDGKPVMDPKTNKPKQSCVTVKVREKFEGTKIEDAKKK
jgi:hypothetical protein